MVSLVDLCVVDFPQSDFFFRFSIEIETYYTSDGGHQENLFHLSNSDARNRVVDLIDVVKDQVE